MRLHWEIIISRRAIVIEGLPKRKRVSFPMSFSLLDTTSKYWLLDSFIIYECLSLSNLGMLNSGWDNARRYQECQEWVRRVTCVKKDIRNRKEGPGTRQKEGPSTIKD